MKAKLSEKKFWGDFEAVRPRVLGALFDGVVGAVAGAEAVDLGRYGEIRMVDFAKWAEAGCRALGFGEGEFLRAFAANQGNAAELALRDDPVAKAVAEFMKGREVWRGNTSVLYKAVQAQSGFVAVNPTWFGRYLRQAAPTLRKAAAIELTSGVDLRPTGEGDKDGIELRKVGEQGD
jgi:hypothetical protein